MNATCGGPAQALRALLVAFISQRRVSVDTFLSLWASHGMDALRERRVARFSSTQLTQTLYGGCLDTLFIDVLDTTEQYQLLGDANSLVHARVALVNAGALFALYLFFLAGREPVRISELLLQNVRLSLVLLNQSQPGDFFDAVRNAVRWMVHNEAFMLCSSAGPLTVTPSSVPPHPHPHPAVAISAVNLHEVLADAGYSLPLHDLVAPSTLAPPSDLTELGCNIATRREAYFARKKALQDKRAADRQARVRRLLAKVYASRQRLRESVATDTAATDVETLLRGLEAQVERIAREHGTAGGALSDDSSDSEASDDHYDLSASIPTRHPCGPTGPSPTPPMPMAFSSSLHSPPSSSSSSPFSMPTTSLRNAELLLLELEQQVEAILHTGQKPDPGPRHIAAREPSSGETLMAPGSASRTKTKPRATAKATPKGALKPKAPRAPRAPRTRTAVSDQANDGPSAPRSPRRTRTPAVTANSGGDGGEDGGAFRGVEWLLADLEATSSAVLGRRHS